MVRYTIRQRLLRVNSRYRQENGTNSNFQYIFNNQYADRCTSLTLQSASIPRLFGNIYAPNNVLSYTTLGFPGVTTITIPPGQYTATELAALFVTPDFTVAYTSPRFEFTFGLALGDITLLASSTIAQLIGLTANTLVAPGPAVLLPSPPSLGGPNQVYLQSGFLGNTRCLDTPQLANYIPLVTPIDCSAVPYGFNIGYTIYEKDVGRIVFDEQLGSIRSIDFQLTDEHGFELILPANANIDLVFIMEYAAD